MEAGAVKRKFFLDGFPSATADCPEVVKFAFHHAVVIIAETGLNLINGVGGETRDNAVNEGVYKDAAVLHPFLEFHGKVGFRSMTQHIFAQRGRIVLDKLAAQEYETF